ncbi:MAG TPA: hypothetical protein VFX17_01310 [Patescibacteria group bacterium]|nr:hypothetical protein [Patescibacteria group bacterium]
MKKLNPKDNAAHLFCLFLAEEMRKRTISLGQAKEMARAVVAHKNLVDNEEHMLRLVIELSKDFPQLKNFEKKLAEYIEKTTRSKQELLITEFVSQIMDSDPNQAMRILDDAIESSYNLDALKAKYPELGQFLNQNQ